MMRTAPRNEYTFHKLVPPMHMSQGGQRGKTEGWGLQANDGKKRHNEWDSSRVIPFCNLTSWVFDHK